MLIEVKSPQLSESVSEATLVTWHKEERPGRFPRREPDRHRDRQRSCSKPGTGGRRAGQDHPRRQFRPWPAVTLIAQIDTEAKAAAGAKQGR